MLKAARRAAAAFGSRDINLGLTTKMRSQRHSSIA
jgi:hypothetical protein